MGYKHFCDEANMRRVNIKYLAITIILILVFVLGAGCEYLPSFTFSTSTSSTTATTTPPPINPTYTLPTETPTITPTTPSFLPDVADVVAEVKPSVVAIDTELAVYDIFGRPTTQKGAGSGWIIDSNGLIVTNDHVVEGANTVTVTLENGQIYTAKTIRTDPTDDLAVIDIGVANLPAAIVEIPQN